MKLSAPEMMIMAGCALLTGVYAFNVGFKQKQESVVTTVAAPTTEAPTENSRDARHFEVTIAQSTPDGALIDAAGYYDWSPGESVPDGQVTIGSIKMAAVQTQWRSCGSIFIRGLSNVADNSSWQGMLEPDGIYRFTTALGTTRTVKAFRISSAADPVAEWRHRNWPGN